MTLHASIPQEWEALTNMAIECEQSLLGACLMIPGAVQKAMPLVSADHFVENLHSFMWETMLSVAEAGEPVNPLTLGVRFGSEEIPAMNGMNIRQYLARCASESDCIPANVVAYAKQVRTFWALRRAAEIGSDLHRGAIVPGADVRSLITETISQLDAARAVVEGRNNGQARTIGEGVATIVDRLDRMRQGEILESAVSTGLRDLDNKLCGGFKPGELIVVAGRPGMGKTLLAVSLTRQMARSHAGGFFSLEMPEAQVCARAVTDLLYSSTTGSVSASQILQNSLSEHEARRVMQAQQQFAALPIVIDDSSSLTVGEIGARTRTMRDQFERAGKRLEFIVIDYLKFLKASERYRGQRHYEVGEITAGLKALAKDLGIAVVLLAQLNREVEKRGDKRPELSDLRESGDIEADADVVMLLFREAYYLANEAKTNPDAAQRLIDCDHKLEIIVAKQRMGSTGSVTVFCDTAASAVRDMARY